MACQEHHSWGLPQQRTQRFLCTASVGDRVSQEIPTDPQPVRRGHGSGPGEPQPVRRAWEWPGCGGGVRYKSTSASSQLLPLFTDRTLAFLTTINSQIYNRRGFLLPQWFPHSSPLDLHKGHVIELHNPRTALITSFWAHVQESPSLAPQNKALPRH